MAANGKFSGREVVIVEAVRTPVGRGHEEKGYYKDTHASTLLADTYTELIRRSGIDAGEVEDVVAGCVQQFGEQAINIGRNAWLEAGLPIETPATTVDRQCGSAQQAVNFAAALIASGVHDVAIGGGVEHMGHISFMDSMEVQKEHGFAFSPKLLERYDLVNQGLSAEMIADKWEIPRSELDELGVRSHQLAARATEEGRFEREIVPMQVNGDTFTADQGIRPDSNVETLSQLKPAFKEDGKITAGNSSQVSDGAAALLLMAREKAEALGLTPRARIVDQTTVGVDPVIMLTGPIPATKKILERNGMTISDIDLFEVNEAFASVVAAWRRELEPDFDRVNVNGGAIALGHPLGSTGARLLTTLLHEMERDDKQMGLVTMCCGGGLGTGTLIETGLRLARRRRRRSLQRALRHPGSHRPRHPCLRKPAVSGRRPSPPRWSATSLLLPVVLGRLWPDGGDEEEADEGFAAGVSRPQTKVEFLTEADRICLSAEQQIEAAADDLLAEKGGLDPAEVERVALEVAVPALETEVRAISAIAVPEGDEDAVEAILAATEQGIAEIEADPRALADGPPPSLRKAQRLAERYGSIECGFSAG